MIAMLLLFKYIELLMNYIRINLNKFYHEKVLNTISKKFLQKNVDVDIKSRKIYE